MNIQHSLKVQYLVQIQDSEYYIQLETFKCFCTKGPLCILLVFIFSAL